MAFSFAVDFFSTLLFSVLLLLAAAGLMVWHVRAWRRPQILIGADQTESKERDYRWRQFRRRMQTTAMIGLVAAALFVGHWITLERVGPATFSVYWGSVLLVVLWVALLAVADMISTKQYFGRIQNSQRVEKARLEAELRRIRAARGDGKPSGGHSSESDA